MNTRTNNAGLSIVSGLLARLRTPAPADVVQVSLTGSPAAVVAVARALAQVVVVTAMAHRPTIGEHIRLDATCHHPRARAGRRS